MSDQDIPAMKQLQDIYTRDLAEHEQRIANQGLMIVTLTDDRDYWRADAEQLRAAASAYLARFDLLFKPIGLEDEDRALRAAIAKRKKPA